MGRIEGDIALESWLFGFRPCRDRGSLPYLPRVNPCPEQGRNPNSQLSSVIFAPILRTEPKDRDQTIHRVSVNGLIVTLMFYG